MEKLKLILKYKIEILIIVFLFLGVFTYFFLSTQNENINKYNSLCEFAKKNEVEIVCNAGYLVTTTEIRKLNIQIDTKIKEKNLKDKGAKNELEGSFNTPLEKEKTEDEKIKESKKENTTSDGEQETKSNYTPPQTPNTDGENSGGENNYTQPPPSPTPVPIQPKPNPPPPEPKPTKCFATYDEAYNVAIATMLNNQNYNHFTIIAATNCIVYS
ncbi:MAG: hypothetical protein ACRCUP_01275 [Mycoplasmatales bacterium]